MCARPATTGSTHTGVTALPDARVERSLSYETPLPMSSPSFAERLATVRWRIEEAAGRAGRDTSAVTLVGVAKRFPTEAVEEALDHGLLDIGENRAQELAQKAAILGERPRWHFVGH